MSTRCCEIAYEMFFVVLIAVILWLLVYCMILIQRCSVDKRYISVSEIPTNRKNSQRDIEKAAFANIL
ncbi:unnamed protein product [Cylicocyclus nassatus]|uniref:Uncharacterized protein n=1 Tax=Cylicocyclus nassatus TaxID=53992 RepID=A0AA36DTS0_CYLNA|nr:unnamed protein product [Cylicocyclus nassatus]